MKRLFKMLAVVLAMTLVIGTIPVSAASNELALKKTSKTLYLGGCKGAKANGKAAPYYSYARLTKLFNNLSDNMKVRATSSNTNVVSTTTTRINAVGTGTADITLSVYKDSVRKANLIKQFTIKVTVKKNATDSDVTFKGISDGKSFKVGDSVTISLPKAKDSDNRRLICDNKDANIVSAGTRKWTVTFTKAGTYKLTAEAFQSATYAKTTASKTITVTVKDTAAPTPTPTPKPVEPEDDKLTLEAQQLTSRSFKISGTAVTEDITFEDVNIQYDIAGLMTSYNRGYNVEFKKDYAIVTVFSALAENTKFEVSVNGATADFTTGKCGVADVTAIKVATSKIVAGSAQPLDIRYLNGDIDITDEVSSLLSSSLTIKQLSGEDYAWCDSDSNIFFTETGRTASFLVSCTLNYDENFNPITASYTATITSYAEPAPVVTSVLYTITDDDGVYMTKADKPNHELAIGEEDKVLEILFGYSSGEYKTLDEAGITDIKVNGGNDGLFLKAAAVLSGGKAVLPIATGTYRLDCYAGKDYVQSVSISIIPARVATSLEVKVSKDKLNVNAYVNDSLTITATIKDQYNQVMNNQPITIEQKEATVTATGYVAFGSFINDKLYVYGTDVSLASKPQDVIIATVKSGKLEQTIRFTVKDIAYDSANLAEKLSKGEYKAELVMEGGSIIDTTLDMGVQNFDSNFVYMVITGNGGYALTEGMGTLVTAKPTAKLKASDLGMVPGSSDFFYTITRNGEYIGSDPCIYADSNNIEFIPVTLGAKLKEGSYVVALYRITAESDHSVISQVAQKSFTVVDNEPEITFKRIADKVGVAASAPAKEKLLKFFEFYIDGVKIKDSDIVNATANFINAANGSVGIADAKLFFSNSAYGDFAITVPGSGSNNFLGTVDMSF